MEIKSENSINEITSFLEIANNQNEGSKQKNVNLKKIILFSLIGILILIILIIVIIFVTKKNEEPKIKCETGEIEKCFSCDTKLNICSKCNIGYYLPENDNIKLTCQKCSVENCEKCFGTKNNDTCSSCSSYLTSLYIDTQIKFCNYTCLEGSEEKCKTCDEVKNQCSSCNKGYFLPKDIESNKFCKKCSVENCQECHGKSDNDTCVTCKEYLTPIYENNFIKYCNYTCKEGKMKNEKNVMK